MAEKELLALVPGFQHDRKEDWEFYLNSNDVAWMSHNRSAYLGAREELESFDDDLLVSLRARKMDKAEKQALRKEYGAKKKRCQAQLEDFAASILERTRALKALGLENRQRQVREESEAFRKRQRVDDGGGHASHSFISPIDAMDVDPEPDNYMPTWTPQPPQPTSTQAPRRDPPQDAESSPSPEPPPRDPLTEGLDEEEAKLVTDLKHVIGRYDCRERVLRAFRSCRAKDNNLKAIVTFHKSLALFRS